MHDRPILAIVLVSTLAVLSLGAAYKSSPMARDPFKGKWDVTITPDDDARLSGAKVFKDALTFNGGKFSSAEMQKKGFNPSSYDEDTRQGGIGGFSAIQTSETDGQAKWSGFVTTDQVEGNLVWTKKDGTVLNFAVKGSKR